MDAFIKDKLLTNYFNVTALVSCGDRKTIFSTLAKIFGADDWQPIFELCENKKISRIKTLRDFNLCKRIRSLTTKSGDKLSAELDEVMRIKGQALHGLKQLELDQCEVMSENEVISKLAEAATVGVIPAMCTYGFMLCEGIGVARDLKFGIKLLSKAANWNCMDAAWMCIYYDSASADRYASRLYAMLIRSPHKDEAERIAATHKTDGEADRLVSLLENAFSRGIAKRLVYEPPISRILDSTALSFKEKQAVILSADKGYITTVSQFPLNACAIPALKINISLPISRESECERIGHILSASHLCSLSMYRPLCVYSDDGYIADAYADAISAAFSGCNVIRLNVNNLPDTAFENGPRSEVLKNMRESRPNIAILILKGKTSPEKLAEIRKFLSTGEREHYKLVNGLTLNVVNLLPVCICDRQNSDALKSVCNLVGVEQASEQEKTEFINREIERNTTLLGFEELSIEEGVMSCLTRCRTEIAVKIVSSLMQALRCDGNSVITLESVRERIRETASGVSLGFGGNYATD